MKRRRHRRASRAQLAALARGRAARLRKLHRNSPARRRRHARRIRKNPVGLGALMTIGNPKRRRKSHRRSHRRSRRSRGLFANPPSRALASVVAAPKEMISLGFVKDAAAVAGGFIIPTMLVAHAPAWARDSQWKVYATKVVATAVVSAGVSMVDKRAAKLVLIGGGASIVLDLWADFIAPHLGMSATPAPAAAPAPSGGTSHFFGDRGMSHFYGDRQGLAGTVLSDAGEDY